MERIHRWAETHDPEFVALLQPSLTRPQIDDLTAGLPFALAEEVYELYQWRGGQNWGEFQFGLCMSDQLRWMPLADAVQEWESYLKESYQDEVDNLNPLAAQIGGWPAADPLVLNAGGWLPLFEMDSDFYTSLGSHKGTTAPVVYVSHDDKSAIFFDSLTAMLEFNADVYESGALRTDDEAGGFFDYTITSALKRRHFPDKIAEAEEEYERGCNLVENHVPGTAEQPTKEEFEQFALVIKLIQVGSHKAVPSVENFLGWLTGDAEQSSRYVRALLHSPRTAWREWDIERSLLVNNLYYSFLV